MTEGRRVWIVQRCIDAFRNEYQDWPGYCERLMTREEMRLALAECSERWPDLEFRGHHVLNQRPGSDRLRVVKSARSVRAGYMPARIG